MSCQNTQQTCIENTTLEKIVEDINLANERQGHCVCCMSEPDEGDDVIYHEMDCSFVQIEMEMNTRQY